MPKIIYIITQSELGGAQKNVLDLALGLKDKYDILVAAGNDGDGAFFEELEKNMIRFSRLKYLRRAIKPIADLRALFEIKSLMKKEQPDIVHLHSSKAGVLGSLAARMNRPLPRVIYTVHGAVFEAAFSAPARKFYLWLEKFTSRFKDKIICVSANDKKMWLKYRAAPEPKLAVIRNGLDYQNIDFLQKDLARETLAGLSSPLFEATQGSADFKIIGTIANFYPEKGLPYFVQAAEIILKNSEFKNLVFAVIGEGMEREILEAMIKKRGLEGKFILTGKISDARRYLKAFNIFILPSVKEGLPYTILEAMAAGVPIIASFVGGIPEMIANNKNGLLVLPKNPDDLAKKITALLKNQPLAETFIQNSKLKLREFSLERMAEETEKIYLKA